MSQHLINIEAIKQLKARYFRALDSKEWELMKQCLSGDCVAKYDGGKYSFTGKEQIVDFFSQFMSDPELIFMHHGHHPEISLIDDNHATGIWYLQDKVIHTGNKTILEGAGFYYDKYINIDNTWFICETGYERTFEMTHKTENTEFTFNRFQL